MVLHFTFFSSSRVANQHKRIQHITPLAHFVLLCKKFFLFYREEALMQRMPSPTDFFGLGNVVVRWIEASGVEITRRWRTLLLVGESLDISLSPSTL